MEAIDNLLGDIEGELAGLGAGVVTGDPIVAAVTAAIIAVKRAWRRVHEENKAKGIPLTPGQAIKEAEELLRRARGQLARKDRAGVADATKSLNSAAQKLDKA